MYESGVFVITGASKQAIIPDRFIPQGVKTFTIVNYGQTMSPVVVETSNDQSTWATATGTTFGSLAATSQAFAYFVDGRPYWRVQGAVGTAGATSYGTWSIHY